MSGRTERFTVSVNQSFARFRFPRGTKTPGSHEMPLSAPSIKSVSRPCACSSIVSSAELVSAGDDAGRTKRSSLKMAASREPTQ